MQARFCDYDYVDCDSQKIPIIYYYKMPTAYKWPLNALWALSILRGL